MSDLVNSRLERYEIRERIGSGGMARVFKAWDTKLERLVAIKILHEHLADDPSFKTRFEREAKIVAAFDHPNIVRIFDYSSFERDGGTLYYMVMSYIPGQTLRRILEVLSERKDRLPTSSVIQITDDLAAALGYAHERGMAHRDVKPGNIILDDAQHAVLTDFGIARLTHSTRLTQDGVSTGTPAYMSPEQASGEAGDERSDLYSLGVICFELLTGSTPFADEGSLSVMLKHINAPIPLVSDVTGESNAKLDLFMQRALAKEPARRFQNATEFISAFRRVFRDDVVTSELLSVQDELTDKPTTIVPSPILSAAAQRTDAKPATQHTSLVQTISQVIRENPRASTGFFVLVAAIMALLIVTLIVASQQRAGEVPESMVSLMGPNTFRSRFDGRDLSDEYWPVNRDTRPFSEITEGRYVLTNDLANTAETFIYQGGTDYRNVSITMRATLLEQSDPESAVGIVFRYQDEDNYNVFAIDGLGRFSIWTRAEGEWRELRDAESRWTRSDAILTRGEENLLSVDIIGDQFTGYVNNERVVRISDATFSAGRVGIYVGAGENRSVVSVEQIQLSQSVPSMTGQ